MGALNKQTDCFCFFHVKIKFTVLRKIPQLTLLPFIFSMLKEFITRN